MKQTTLSVFVKAMRKQYNLTQVDQGWACALYANWNKASKPSDWTKQTKY